MAAPAPSLIQFHTPLLLALLAASLVVTWSTLQLTELYQKQRSSLPTGGHPTPIGAINQSLNNLEPSLSNLNDFYEDEEGKREIQMTPSFDLHANLTSTSNVTIANLDLESRVGLAHRRVKRGVIGLASMIKCITGCNPLSYKDYGCYCGFQGDGYPVDGIDRCCYNHDMCYSQTDCNQALVYFVSYKWICQSYGRAKCGRPVKPEPKPKPKPKSPPANKRRGGARRPSSSHVHVRAKRTKLCECDRRFAKCLSRYRCPKSKPTCQDDVKHLFKLFGK